MKPMNPPDYRAESDAHTLVHAEEIKADKSRHKAAKKHAKGKAKQMAKVAGVAMPKKAVGSLMQGFMK